MYMYSKEVGSIGGNLVYTVKGTEMFPIRSPDAGASGGGSSGGGSNSGGSGAGGGGALQQIWCVCVCVFAFTIMKGKSVSLGASTRGKRD